MAERRRFGGFGGRFGGRIGVTTFVVALLCVVSVVSIGVVLAIGLGVAAKNTRALNQERGRLTFRVLSEGVRAYLQPTIEMTDWLARVIEEGGPEAADPEALTPIVRAALTGGANARSVNFLHYDGWMASAYRDDERVGHIEVELVDWRENPYIARAMRDGLDRNADAAYWDAPIYVAETNSTQLARVSPVVVDGAVIGAVVASVQTTDLSAFLATLDPVIGHNVYILTLDNRAIAHRALTRDPSIMSGPEPLPPLNALEDPVLAQLGPIAFRGRREGDPEGPPLVWQSEVGGAQYQVLVHEELGDWVFAHDVFDFGEGARWRIGVNLPEALADQEFRQLVGAGFVGLVVLVITALVAALIGLGLARPVRRLAAAANAATALDFDRARLPPSRLKEWHEAASAFDGMVAALRSFARYAPKPLVKQLLALDDDARRPRTAEVTVMFTDICGFTTLVETKDAEATAAMLNQHFEVVCACIAEEGGVIDKFIGDSVMAFWGAPERMEDHAARAVRTARAIKRRCEAVGSCLAAPASADPLRETAPDEGMRIRIGVHTGSVVVGEIGASDRLNYTIVGDPVNVAQRIEGLAKLAFDADASAKVAIAVSAATAARAPDQRFRSLGEHVPRGRRQAIEIFTPIAP